MFYIPVAELPGGIVPVCLLICDFLPEGTPAGAVTQPRKGSSASGPNLQEMLEHKGLQTTIPTMQPSESFRDQTLLVHGS